MRSILTVITPAADQLLTSLVDAKRHLGITDSSKDTLITSWIGSASAAIASSCVRVFGKEVVRQTVFVDGFADLVSLERRPSSAVTEVKVDGTVLGAGFYLLNGKGGLLFRLDASGNMVAWTGNKVEISYTGGYTLLSELPQDLQRACLSLVGFQSMYYGRDPMAKRIEIPGVQTVDYWVGSTGPQGELPPDVAVLIAPYRSLYV